MFRMKFKIGKNSIKYSFYLVLFIVVGILTLPKELFSIIKPECNSKFLFKLPEIISLKEKYSVINLDDNLYSVWEVSSKTNKVFSGKDKKEKGKINTHIKRIEKSNIVYEIVKVNGINMILNKHNGSKYEFYGVLKKGDKVLCLFFDVKNKVMKIVGKGDYLDKGLKAKRVLNKTVELSWDDKKFVLDIFKVKVNGGKK